MSKNLWHLDLVPIYKQDVKLSFTFEDYNECLTFIKKALVNHSKYEKHQAILTTEIIDDKGV